MIDGGEATGWSAAFGRLAAHPLVPPAFAMVVATLCVRGVFTLSKIFYFRDLRGLPVQDYWYDMKFW